VPTRSTKNQPTAFQPVDLEAKRLVRDTVELCSAIPKWERYPFTERALTQAHDAGLAINRACRIYDLQSKVLQLRKACGYLDDLRYTIEVIMTADLVATEKKVPWDERYLEVRRQVALLLNSLQDRLRTIPSREAESAAGSCGATSNKKDAPSH
jgi:hypothetical protein